MARWGSSSRARRKQLHVVLAAGMFVVSSVTAHGAARTLSILPEPVHLERKEGSLDLSRGLSIDTGQDKDAASVALYLEEMDRKSGSVAILKMGPSNQRKTAATVIFTGADVVDAPLLSVARAVNV